MRSGANAPPASAARTYREMLLQVARDYPGVNPRTLTITEIVFFYEGLRPELIEFTKPKK